LLFLENWICKHTRQVLKRIWIDDLKHCG
jgi:hypothetical protein